MTILQELEPFKLGMNPLENFLIWYEMALPSEDNADAMTVSTYDKTKSRPVSRTILYKGIKDEKIIFYTNYLSQKGLQLEENQEVSLLFYWHKSIRQVRIQGRVKKTMREDSIQYFHSRDRDSQLASFISEQSRPIANKSELEKKLQIAQNELGNSEIPCPLHWGGYLVEPYEFEFFIYGKNRLNDRFLFELEKGDWTVNRLQP